MIVRAARPLVRGHLRRRGGRPADDRRTGRRRPPQDPRQVQAELDSLRTQAETASEDYNAAQVDLATTQKQLGVAKAKVARIKAQTQDLLANAGDMAAQAYMSGGGGMESSVGLLMSEDPASFLDQATAVQQLSRSQNSTLRRARSAQLVLAQAEAQLAQEQAAAAKAAAEDAPAPRRGQRALSRTSRAARDACRPPTVSASPNIAAAKKKAAAAAAAAAPRELEHRQLRRHHVDRLHRPRQRPRRRRRALRARRRSATPTATARTRRRRGTARS